MIAVVDLSNKARKMCKLWVATHVTMLCIPCYLGKFEDDMKVSFNSIS